MAFDRDKSDNTLVFKCDDCTAKLRTETREFASAMGIMRNHGWASIKRRGNHLQVCRACANDQENR